jgi:integrase
VGAPRERSKGGIEHRIPLSPTAVDLLRRLEAARKSPSQFVFAGGKIGRPVSNPQKWIARIRPRAKLIDFRFHDLRRTAASGMTAIGVERLTVSKILNHAEGGVTKIYDRHSYDNEKCVAMIKWNRHLQRLLTGEADEPKVVQLHA